MVLQPKFPWNSKGNPRFCPLKKKKRGRMFHVKHPAKDERICKENSGRTASAGALALGLGNSYGKQEVLPLLLPLALGRHPG